MKATIIAVLVLIGSSLSSKPVGANDSFAEVAAGGIKFLKQADIVYLFANPTNKDVAITVAFLAAHSPQEASRQAR